MKLWGIQKTVPFFGPPCRGCGKKSSPLKFFAVFSATVWHFNLKFYRCISWKVLQLTAKWNVILSVKYEVTDSLTWLPIDFAALKCSSYNTNSVTSLKPHSKLMIRCQNSIVTVNVQSGHRQLQAWTQVFSRLIWEVFHNLVDWSLGQVAPDNPKRFLDSGDCFRLCFTLAVSLQLCTLYVIIH